MSEERIQVIEPDDYENLIMVLNTLNMTMYQKQDRKVVLFLAEFGNLVLDRIRKPIHRYQGHAGRPGEDKSPV